MLHSGDGRRFLARASGYEASRVKCIPLIRRPGARVSQYNISYIVVEIHAFLSYSGVASAEADDILCHARTGQLLALKHDIGRGLQ